ncbi:MAG: DNA primase DnaG [Candidatus Micrarchaeia archaeon]
MAKTYIDIVKYMVTCRFEISGLVEKPDIIGAVFGQTEGLLGGDLDLRELQKSGKIGRIEIEASTNSSKTFGKLYLPSSLGRVETCILAAAIESVDRVGPFDTSIKVEKIEDTRNEKRKKVIARAKDLLKTLINTEIPDSKEMSELVEVDVKASAITTYGPENLPAGPDISTNNELILVEGRADVINLLKNDISNCIAVGGATGSIPKTIIDLTRSKETTLFVDGDRGGDMIIKSIMSVCDIDFIAKAPSGKEVEELTRKDIIKALRSKVPVEQALSKEHQNGENHNNQGQSQSGQNNQQSQGQQNQQRYSRPQTQPVVQQHMPEAEPYHQKQQNPGQDEILSPSSISKRIFGPSQNQQRQESRNEEQRAAPMAIKSIDEDDEKGALDSIPSIKQESKSSGIDQKLIDALEELHNTLRGRLYGDEGNLIKEVPIRELIQSMQDTDGVKAVVFDGIITQRLLELAGKRNIKAIYGIRAGQITRPIEGITIYTKEREPV